MLAEATEYGTPYDQKFNMWKKHAIWLKNNSTCMQNELHLTSKRLNMTKTHQHASDVIDMKFYRFD